MAGLFGRADPPANEVCAEGGSVAVGGDIHDSLIQLGLDEQAIASLMSGMEARLLAAIAAQPATREARAAGVEARVFVLLARRINVAVEDEAQALAELEMAITELARLQETAERGSNLDAMVDEALRRVAEKARRGEFDEAAKEAERAFDAWQECERERRARERADGLRLVEANIEQHRFRRDAKAMALWVERGLAIEVDAEEAPMAALYAKCNEWWQRGWRSAVQLDLEVAAEIARGALGRDSLSSDKSAKWHFVLGNALSAHGERESGKGRLEEAAKAYRAALDLVSRARDPSGWASNQNGLGNALKSLGERDVGTAHLNEAVVAYRAALKIWTRDRDSSGYASAQSNLSDALRILGVREGGPARLEEAVEASRAALTIWTRESEPDDWAIAQNNLGNALSLLGEIGDGTERLQEAADAFHAALTVWARERLPHRWATTQSNLGNTLSVLAVREADPEKFEASISAHHAALEVWTRERFPRDWGTAQLNLGNALTKLGILEEDICRLREASDTYAAALSEKTRGRVPLEWADAALNRCHVEYLVALQTHSAGRLAELQKQAGDVLEFALQSRNRPLVIEAQKVYSGIGRLRVALGDKRS